MPARVMRLYHGLMRQGLLFAAIVGAWPAAGHGQVPDRGDAARAFETVRQVLQHPRCQNCHIPGNAPLQYDQGLPHAMKVERGADGHGTALKCSYCHQTSNPPAGYSLHAPPGAPNWHLPPANMKMVFKDLTSAELCRVLKDPKRNGGKTPAQLLKHVAEDKLVLWGWEPGGERTPVPVPHVQFVTAFKQWISGDMPCS